MATFPFEISAQLVLTVQQDQVLVVAEENYVMVQFSDHAALERVAANVLPPSTGKNGRGLLASLEKAQGLSRKLWEAGVVVEVRVKGKSYLELGSSASPKLKANAIFGKIGSWLT